MESKNLKIFTFVWQNILLDALKKPNETWLAMNLYLRSCICLQWMSDQMQMAVSKEVTPWPWSAEVKSACLLLPTTRFYQKNSLPQNLLCSSRVCIVTFDWTWLLLPNPLLMNLLTSLIASWVNMIKLYFSSKVQRSTCTAGYTGKKLKI